MNSIKQREQSVELLQESILSSKYLLEEIFAVLPENNVVSNKLVSIVMKDIMTGYRLENTMALNLAKKIHSISDRIGVQATCRALSKEIVTNFNGEKQTIGYGILMKRLESY